MNITNLIVPDPESWSRVRQARKTESFQYLANLLCMKNILDKYKINFFLAFGTLLGAIRDKDFIEGDVDSDIGIIEKEEEKLVTAVNSKEFLTCGLELIRVHNLFLISVAGGNQYLDIYIFRPQGAFYQCCDYKIEKWRLDNPDTLEFHKNKFYVPKDPESYLTRVYGNWHEKSNKHAEC